MAATFELTPIGSVEAGPHGFALQLDEPFWTALAGLDGFSHVTALWWLSGCDTPGDRVRLVEEQPYAGAPGVLGTFATRSPRRPNPIAVSVVSVIGLEMDRGRVELGYIDADDGTPLLDLKPYTPSLDRVERPAVPGWCARWPGSIEESAEFDWSSVFRFP